MSKYEHCFIRGIPYYRDAEGRIYNFDTKSDPIHIGQYTVDTDDVILVDNWRELVSGSLTKWREGLGAHERDKLRDFIIKPKKSRKTTRNTGKRSKTADTESK